MTDITNLIKGSTHDIIAVTTIWALINNQPISYYFKYNNTEFYYTYLTYKTLIGVGVSFYVMSKYY
jgi:hypothetical protein